MKRKESIQEPDNPSKRAEEDSITDEKICNSKKDLQKNVNYMGEPLAKFWLFASIGETD